MPSLNGDVDKNYKKKKKKAVKIGSKTKSATMSYKTPLIVTGKQSIRLTK